MIYIFNSGDMEHSVPTGSEELMLDKISKKSVRWNKTSGLHDRGTVDEAGTFDPLGRRGCQKNKISKIRLSYISSCNVSSLIFMIYITEEEVASNLKMEEIIDTLKSAFMAYHKGQASVSARMRDYGKGFVLSTMPAVIDTMGIAGAKIYASGQDHSHFQVIVFSTKTKDPLAIIEADKLGQMRTGALAALASSIVVNRKEINYGLAGSGYQAESNLEAHDAVFTLKEIKVYSRNFDHSRDFASRMSDRIGKEVIAVRTPEEMIDGSEIINTVTNANSPIITGGMLSDNFHLNLVGSNMPFRREVSKEVLEESDFIFVEHLEQAMKESVEVSEFARANPERKIYELKEVIADPLIARNNKRTIFKSMGIGLEDVATAWVLLKNLGILKDQ
jgi:alanine dehydrogenase